MDMKFWKNKTVFLTGHTGFKGAWLSFWLNELGATVVGYSLAPSPSQKLYETLELGERMKSIFSDISDLSVLRSAIESASPDIVLHMAAQPLVQQSFNEPYETFKTNVLGTVSLLEAVRHCPSIRAVVVVTTDKCYQNNEWIWPYREVDRLGGEDPYSSSKACAELVTHSFHKSFFSYESFSEDTCSVATARAGNVIGGGDWAEDRLIPDLVRAVESEKKLILRNPDATRPWQFVLEPLRGYLMLAQQLYENGNKFSGGWNFGPLESDSRSVKWVVNKVCEALDYDENSEISGDKNFAEKRMLRLDISKAESELGWKPIFSVSESIQHTADWYASYLSGGNLCQTTKEQLSLYESLIN